MINHSLARRFPIGGNPTGYRAVYFPRAMNDHANALMSRGLDRAMQAHTQMVREQLHAATTTLGMS